MAPSKVQTVVTVVLGWTGGKVHRTKLVKLVYLADEKFYEATGRTMSGLAYAWDSFGPNAVGNAIVREAERLVSAGRAHMVARPNAYGSESYLYWVPDEAFQEEYRRLDPGERQIIYDTVKKYGQLGVKAVVAASKRTKPFRTARPYGLLQLEASPQALAFQGAIAKNADFMNAAHEVLRRHDPGRLVDDEELDALLKQKS